MKLTPLIPTLALLFAAQVVKAADPWEGPLVLTVNGKEVTLTISSSSHTAGDDGEPATFTIDSSSFVLFGHVDLNGDGKADKKDAPKPDPQGKLDPKALINKNVLLSPTDPGDIATIQTHVKLPGLGDCAVLKGSTLSVTKYTRTGKEIDRISGTVDLLLKPKKGDKLRVTGRFECGFRAD